MVNWKRTFIILWTGQFMSLLSSAAVNFAIILWLSIETGSAEILAYAAIAGLLPQSVLGLFSGVFVDRWNRKTVMILSDSFIALCTLVMVLLFHFRIAETWFIFILMGLRSAGSAFHMPAMQASVPLLAPESELLRIAGINQIIQSVCNIAGPALGALLISWLDISQVLMADILGAGVAVISLLFITIPQPERFGSEKPDIIGEIKTAIREVAAKRGMGALVIISVLATFCIMPVAVMFPLMTLKYFGGNSLHVSVVEVVWGVGMLLGGALLGSGKYRMNKVILINLMYVFLGLCFVFSGLLPAGGFIIFVVLTGIGGMTGAIYNAAFTAVIQEKIDPAMLGRVFSMYFSVALLPSLIGLLGTGYMADHIGLTSSFVILGAVILVLGIISFYIPPLLKLGRKQQSG